MVKTAAYLVVTACIVALLVLAKSFLVPLVLAVLFWYLINAIYMAFQNLAKGKIPTWLGLSFSSILFFSTIYFLGTLIATNINDIISDASKYEINLEEEVRGILNWVGYTKEVSLERLAQDLDLSQYLSSLINSVTNVAGSSFLILLYVLFLLLEQSTFPRKLAKLSMSEDRRAKVNHILHSTNLAIRKYVTVKTFTSLLTAVLAFIVIKAFGIYYAFFWAFLIFILNFIPSIGSIVATTFPALQALIQFETPSYFFLVFVVVSAVQMFVGNLLEPRLMGNSLNISPLVVILSLVFWGFLWGIVGMLLCVPITVCMLIVFAQFPTTRPVAVLLSRTGEVDLPIRPSRWRRSMMKMPSFPKKENVVEEKDEQGLIL